MAHARFLIFIFPSIYYSITLKIVKVSNKSVPPNMAKIWLITHYTLWNRITHNQLQKFENPTSIRFCSNTESHLISVNCNNKISTAISISIIRDELNILIWFLHLLNFKSRLLNSFFNRYTFNLLVYSENFNPEDFWNNIRQYLKWYKLSQNYFPRVIKLYWKTLILFQLTRIHYGILIDYKIYLYVFNYSNDFLIANDNCM